MAKQPPNRAVYFESDQVYQNRREMVAAPPIWGLRWLNRWRLVLTSRRPYALSGWSIACLICGTKFVVKPEYGHKFTLACDAAGCRGEMDVNVMSREVIHRVDPMDEAES